MLRRMASAIGSGNKENNSTIINKAGLSPALLVTGTKDYFTCRGFRESVPGPPLKELNSRTWPKENHYVRFASYII